MMPALVVTLSETLPEDASVATLVGRAWLPGIHGGPCVVALRDGQLHDITAHVPTMAALVARQDRVALVREAAATPLGPLTDWLESTSTHGPDTAQRPLLAPCAPQVGKAAAVPFRARTLEPRFA